MRRMLPQKLIDYIKELKNSNIYIDRDGFLNVDGGINLNGDAFSEIGNGLEIDDGALQVKAKTNGGIEVSSDGVALSKPLYVHNFTITGKDDEGNDTSITCVGYGFRANSLSGTYNSGLAMISLFSEFICINLTIADEKFAQVQLSTNQYDELNCEYVEAGSYLSTIFNFDNEQTATIVDVVS